MQKIIDTDVVILVYYCCNCVLCAPFYQARVPFQPVFDKLNLSG